MRPVARMSDAIEQGLSAASVNGFVPFYEYILSQPANWAFHMTPAILLSSLHINFGTSWFI